MEQHGFLVMDLEDADDNHVHVQEDVPDAVGSIEEEVAVDSTEEDLEVEALYCCEEALRVEVSTDKEAPCCVADKKGPRGSVGES